MTAAPKQDAHPKTLGDVRTRIWLETLNALAEYGSLVIFSAGTVGIEAMRQKWNLPVAGNAAVLTTEVVSAMTMIVPKAIRALGEIVQILGISAHDGYHALRHGERRPRAITQEKK